MLSIYNKINDYIIVLNFSGDVIFCNKSFLKRLSYNEKEIVKLNIFNLIDEYKDIDDLVNKNDGNLKFFTKENELLNINSNITMEKFNGEESIFIIGKEVNLKPYTMEMLENLLDNINIATFIINNEGEYLYVNEPFTEIVNKKKDEIIGTHNRNHWETSTYESFDQNNKEVFYNRSPKIFNEKIIIDNNIHWYKSYKAPIYDKNKNPKYIVATTTNINLSKTLSEELYKNYNKSIIENKLNKDDNLNKILKDTGEHILNYTKADGLSLLLYDEIEEKLRPTINLKNLVLNIKDTEYISLKKEDLISRKYVKYCNCILPKEKLSNVLDKGMIMTENMCYFGNYTIKLYDEFMGIIALNYKNGNYPRFNCDEYMKHICSKIAMVIKNAELSQEVYVENKKRIHTEKELQRYLNISVDLVAIVGRDGYIKRLSPNWSNVLGWSEEELLSMKITDIVHPQELKTFENKKKFDDIEGQITRNIIRYRHKNGKYICLEWSSEYISKEEIYITTARDITKKLEIEKEKNKLEEVVKLEVAKNEVFSNISHEFRTPINILLGTTQVIEKNIEKNKLHRENLIKYSKYIKQNSYRLLRLVNNLIDMNKIDLGQYKLRCSNENIINIIEDITQSVVVYTKNNKIDLIFDTDEEEVITYCDPDKIERIMLNILSNAIKYTPENGLIKVTINTNDENVIVSIKDSGIGIPREKLDVIFDRFGQVDPSLNRTCEGSGIGLSIVKNLVQMHGGEISVDSKMGEGSEFKFNIPIRFKEKNDTKKYDDDRKSKHVERCNIEFSDIYSM